MHSSSMKGHKLDYTRPQECRFSQVYIRTRVSNQTKPMQFKVRTITSPPNSNTNFHSIHPANILQHAPKILLYAPMHFLWVHAFPTKRLSVFRPNTIIHTQNTSREYKFGFALCHQLQILLKLAEITRTTLASMTCRPAGGASSHTVWNSPLYII